MRHARVIRRSTKGFSLIELLVVVAVLSATAYVALDAVDNDTSQIRFDMTQQRMGAVRTAIIGEQGLSANGTPVIAGFVADVGQLPPCLRALLVQNADCDQDETADFTPPPYQQIGALTFGWRGPYISENPVSLRDAWGNSGEELNNIAPEIEFGWQVTAAASTFDLLSFGRDRAVGGTDVYDVDQSMQTIAAADFTVDLSASVIDLDLNNTSAAALNVCVAIQAPDPSDETGWMLIEGGTATLINPGETASITFSPASTVTQGVRPILIYDNDDASVSDCSITAGQEANFLLNAIFATRNFLFVPRVTPAASMAFTLP